MRQENPQYHEEKRIQYACTLFFTVIRAGYGEDIKDLTRPIDLSRLSQREHGRDRGDALQAVPCHPLQGRSELQTALNW
jgi:hypothetical protein